MIDIETDSKILSIMAKSALSFILKKNTFQAIFFKYV